MTAGLGTKPVLDGETVVRLAATAIMQLSRRCNPGQPVYDDVVQRALNHVGLLALQSGVAPPSSVADLVRWAAHRRLGEWPIELPSALASGDVLLVDPETRSPTQQCLEWEIAASDALAEEIENKVMLGAMATCRNASAPESYTAFRNLLITRPVLTHIELLSIGDADDELDLVLLTDTIRQCYEPAPASLRRGGEYRRCGRCNCLLVPVGENDFRCELERCRRDTLLMGPVVETDRYGIVYQLVRPLRIFVTGPGIAETSLESELNRLGLTVEMWPNFDTYDLRVTVPNGEVWALDVKDRANPALLARGSQPLRPDPPYDRAFLVIPQYRFDDRKDYATVFVHHTSSELRERIELVSDTELLTAIKKQLRAAGARPTTLRTKNA